MRTLTIIIVAKNSTKTTFLFMAVPLIEGHFYYTTLFTLYKSPEKKRHRSPKMDKNKCPFFKRVMGLCEMGSLKNTL
jgi:capsule polysaccharide modification protein KpsS